MFSPTKMSTSLVRFSERTFEISRGSNFQKVRKSSPPILLYRPASLAVCSCCLLGFSGTYIRGNIGVHRALIQPFKRRMIAKPAASHRPPNTLRYHGLQQQSTVCYNSYFQYFSDREPLHFVSPARKYRLRAGYLHLQNHQLRNIDYH